MSQDASAHGKKAIPREWLAERISAAAAAPLALWFITAVIRTDSLSRTEFAQWAGKPVNATCILAFVITASAHARMGLDNIIDDYSRGKWHRRFRLLNRVIIGGGILLTIRMLYRFYKLRRAHNI